MLSNTELLAIIIGTGTHNKSAIDLSREILKRCHHDLAQLARWNIADFCKIDGIGKAKAVSLMATFELSARKKSHERALKETITSSMDAYLMMRPVLEDLAFEEFWLMTLNRKNTVTGKYKISEGGITSTVVDQRKIFKLALDNRSTAIILFHNHPSGNTQPSESDNVLTRKLIDAGKLLDINVLDHLILADDAYYSFADEGFM